MTTVALKVHTRKQTFVSILLFSWKLFIFLAQIGALLKYSLTAQMLEQTFFKWSLFQIPVWEGLS